MNIRTFVLGMLLTISGIFIFEAANAHGQHPYYLKAISDLVSARRMLMQHIGDNEMTHNEKEALRQINEVIMETSKAINYSNSPNDLAKVNKQKDAAQQLPRCISFLKKAKADISHEADSRFADGLRDRCVKNCDLAIKFVEQAKHG